jgi:hypothetical protein
VPCPRGRPFICLSPCLPACARPCSSGRGSAAGLILVIGRDKQWRGQLGKGREGKAEREKGGGRMGEGKEA